MKALYHTISGHIYAEDISPHCRSVVFEDGDHPMTQGAVKRDIDHELEPIYLVYQGISAPEGDSTVRENVIQTDQLRQWKHRIYRQGLFWRRFTSAFWSFAYVSTIFVQTVLLYLLLWTFVWAAFRVQLPL